MPASCVMGQMLVLGVLSDFMTLELDEPCEKRKANKFLAGLFHDRPEGLTRDIVSPVKRSVEGLDELIHEIEEEQMAAIIYPLLPAAWHDELKYFLHNEFDSKIVKNGKVETLSSDMINELYNDDHFNPVDGEIIRGCDHLSAYIESYLSISCGVYCDQMSSGHAHLTEKYKKQEIGGIPFDEVFAYFNIDGERA